jgi:hypothetical protein
VTKATHAASGVSGLAVWLSTFYVTLYTDPRASNIITPGVDLTKQLTAQLRAYLANFTAHLANFIAHLPNLIALNF